MRKKILITLATLAAVLIVSAGVVAMQPSEFKIVRSAKFAVAPSKAFAQVNDFHNWESWSPWAKLDPAAKNSFEGSSSGKGAIFKWSGNNEVGEGKMTITESRPDERIQIKLEFVRPFEDSSTSEFTFNPDGDQTVVTWTMTGRQNFIGKAVCLFMNMDKIVGGQFEKGLANMKTVIETPTEN